MKMLLLHSRKKEISISIRQWTSLNCRSLTRISLKVILMSLKTRSTMSTMMKEQMSSTNSCQSGPERLKKRPETRKIDCKRRLETSLKMMGMHLKKTIMTLPIKMVLRVRIRNTKANLKLWISDSSKR